MIKRPTTEIKQPDTTSTSGGKTTPTTTTTKRVVPPSSLSNSSGISKQTTSSTSSSPTSTSTLKSKPLSSITSVPRTTVNSKYSSLPTMSSSSSTTLNETKRTTTPISSSINTSSSSTPQPLIGPASRRRPLNSSSSSSSTRSSSSSSSTTLSTTTTTNKPISSASIIRQQRLAKQQELLQQRKQQLSQQQQQVEVIDLTASTSSSSSDSSDIQSPEFNRVVSEFIVLDDQVSIEGSSTLDHQQQQQQQQPYEQQEQDEEEEILEDEVLDEEEIFEQQVVGEDYSNVVYDTDEVQQQQQQQQETNPESIEQIQNPKKSSSSSWFSSFLNLLPSSSSSISPPTKSPSLQSSTNISPPPNEQQQQQQLNQNEISTNNIDTINNNSTSYKLPPITPPLISQQHYSNPNLNNNNPTTSYNQPPQPHPHHLMYNNRISQPPSSFYQGGYSLSTPNLNQYRSSTQIYSPPHLMYPHNQPNGLALLPYTVSPQRAITIFQEWYKSLWFAPTNFRERLEESLEMNYLFVPYYAFTSMVSSTHQGRVGHLKSVELQQAIIVGGNESNHRQHQEEEIEWTRATTNPYTQTHTDVLIFAPSSDDQSSPPYQDIKEISSWKIEFTEPYHVQHPQLNHPINDLLNHQQQQQQLLNQQQLLLQGQGQGQGNINQNQNYLQKDSKLYKVAKPLDKMTMEEAWKFAEQKIKRNECYGNDLKLKKDHLAHTVSDVETITNFDNITFRTIYMPIYSISYMFEGEKYNFFINGQNGNNYGLRPYGIGSIKNTAIRFLTAGIFEKTGSTKVDKQTVTQNGMIKGADLNQIDKDDNYIPHRYYLLLPSSDQFLMIKTIGFVILKNNGLEDLILESHLRMSDELGGECILKAGENQTFAFKGTWCIGVKQGDPSSLELLRVETNSGNDKPIGDLQMSN